ncbi:MAG: PAS domain S-box protein [Cellvibrionaceae bacterium]
MTTSVSSFRPIWIWTVVLICFVVVMGASISTFISPSLIQLLNSQGVSILIDWSTLLVASITVFIALFHFSIYRNSAVLIIGAAVLCVSLMETYLHVNIFHERVVDYKNENSNKSSSEIINFSWSMMRFCSSSLMGVATVALLWGPRSARLNQDEVIPNKSYHIINTFIILTILSLITIVFIKLIQFIDEIYVKYLETQSLTSEYNSITSVYLILGSLLFLSMGGFFSFVWYRSDKRAINFGLLLSFIPQVCAQLYFLLSSGASNEVHYLGMQCLLCVSYAIIAISIVNDKSVPVELNQYAIKDETNKEEDREILSPSSSEIIKTFDVGNAKRPLGIQIPIAAFMLATSIAAIVGYGFYTQSAKVEENREVEDLRVKSKLVEYLAIHLFKEAENDIQFLEGTPPIQGIITAIKNNDEVNYKLWVDRLNQIFLQMIKNKKNYLKIEYIETNNFLQNIVSVSRDPNDLKTLNSDVKDLHGNDNDDNLNQRLDSILGFEKNDGQQVFFSSVEFKDNSYSTRPTFEVSVQVKDTEIKNVFGLIIIHVDFEKFIDQLIKDDVVGVNIYAANEKGAVLHWGNREDKNNLSDENIKIKDLFPEYNEEPSQGMFLRSVRHRSQREKTPENNTEKNKIRYITEDVSDNKSIIYYRSVLLNGLSNDAKIILFMHHQRSIIDQHLINFRNRSILIGLVLALVALLLAVFASFKISLPLRQMSQAVQAYHRNGVMQDLPVDSKDEIGVLARSFKNLIVSMDDISESQKYSSREAKESSDKLQAIVDSAADAIITINEIGVIQSFNLAAEKMFCYQESEVIGKSINILMPASFAERHDGFLKQYLLTGVSGIIGVGRELKGVKKDGVEFPMHLAISEVFTNSGRFFTGIVRDISIQKNAEVERTESLALLEATLESTENAIMVADHKGNLLRVNSRFTELWEIPEEFYEEGNERKLLNHAIHLVKDPMKLVRVIKGIVDDPEKETSDIIEFKDERVIERVSRKMNLADNKYGRVWSFRDITMKKKAETALIEAKTEAENAARYKSEFLASMSHEIRTPMNGVLGMLSLMLKGNLKGEQRNYAELAKSSAESLLGIVNDILDFSKVEAGRLDLEILEFNLVDVLEDFTGAMAYRAQEKNIALILDTSDIKSEVVMGDPGRIRQILTNLVGNAIKFTQRGEVIITASLEDVGNNQKKFMCSVSDTGVGIAQEKINTIFDSFTQVDASTTRVYGGTGLGLAIAKQLCELMGGDISAESIMGMGSRFDFSVLMGYASAPITKEEKLGIDNKETAMLNGANIILVEKNRATSHLMSKQLSLWGAGCTEISNIEDMKSVLEFNIENDFNENIDAIFVDENCLAENSLAEDGLEDDALDNEVTFSQRVRLFKGCHTTKIFLLSKIHKDSDKESRIHNHRLNNFNAELKKPITKKDYAFCSDIIVNGSFRHFYDQESYLSTGVLGASKSTSDEDKQDRSQGEIKKQLAKKRLLLVEDNYVNQHVAAGMLEDIGISCDIAGNGMEAITALTDSPKNASYDLILMDCQMPEMDGFDATTNIRKGLCGERYIEIPIVAMTANAMKGDRERCLATGMTDYISKPIDYSRLEEMIVKVALGDSFISNATSNSSSVEKQQSVDSFIKNTDLHIWDQESALKRVRGKKERLIKLIHMFHDDMPERLKNLKTHMNNDQFIEASDVAHTIKGVAGNLGAEKLMDLASRIELQSKTENGKDIDQLLTSLSQQYDDVSQKFFDFIDINTHLQ